MMKVAWFASHERTYPVSEITVARKPAHSAFCSFGALVYTAS